MAASMTNPTWLEWAGGECPVEGDTLVDVEVRCGGKAFGFPASDRPRVGFWNRAWRGRSRDIVRYRLSGDDA